MTFNGIYNFTNYNEIRSLTCTGFIFTWSYLVKFTNKQSSEKQEILISSVEEDVSRDRTSSNLLNELFLIFLDSDKYFETSPQILYSIECTDKTWGIEIAELIRRHLTKSVKLYSYPYFKFRKLATENLFRAYFLFPMAFLAYKLFTIASSLATNLCNDFIAKKAGFMGEDISINKKVDFLINAVSYCNTKIDMPSNIFNDIPIILAAFIAPLFLYLAIKLPNFRFILFTDESERKRRKYFKDLDRNNLIIWTILGSIICSVIASYAFQYLSKIR
jgi:hypothetical protein